MTLHKIIHTSSRYRLVLVAAATTLFAWIYLTLQPPTDSPGLILLPFLPVTLAGLFFGWRGGLAASLLTILLGLFLFYLSTGSDLITMLRQGGVAAQVALVFCGVSVGLLKDLDEHRRLACVERQRFEAAQRASEERYRELQATGERQEQELSLLEQVRTALAREIYLPVILRTVVEAVASSFNYQFVSIYLVEGSYLVLHHHVGYEAVFEKIPLTEGIMSRAVRTRQPVLLEDIQSDPCFLAAMPEVVSEIAVPLFAHGAVAGVLNVESTHGMRLGEADLRLLTALGEHIRIAFERAQLYTEVRQSEERFRKIFEEGPLGMALVDLRHRFVRVNATFCQMLGYSEAELLAKTTPEITHPDDREPGVQLSNQLFNEKVSSYRTEKRYIKKNGEIVWTRLTASIIHDTNNAPQYELGMVEDITGWKRYEQALRESEERFRTSVETLLDGFAIFSPVRDSSGKIVDFRYEYINEAGCRLNERSREDHIGYTILDLLPNHGDAGLIEEYGRVVETGVPFIKEALVYEDNFGSNQRLSKAFDIRAFKLGDGFAVVWRDVTQRKRMEDAEHEQRILAEALRDTAAALTSTPHLNEVLDRILENVGRVLPHENASIMLVENGIARAVGCRGYLEQELEDYILNLRLNVDNMMTLRWMAEHGQPLIIPDTDLFEGWIVFPQSSWVRSYAGAPIQVKGSIAGFVNLTSAIPGYFTPDRAEPLQAFANQAAIAIDNARLFEEVRRANSMVMALSHIATRIEKAPDPDGVMETLGAELRKLGLHCLILLQDGETEELLARYISIDPLMIARAEKLTGLTWSSFRLKPEAFPSLREVFVCRRAVFLSDSKQVMLHTFSGLPDPQFQQLYDVFHPEPEERWFFLPLAAEEQVFGVLWMWGKDLQESDLPAASLFASQVAVTLEKARLYAKTQQLAITDELTETFNRRGLLELGQREVERSRRFRHPLSAVILDIDRFKDINDRFGHITGDQVLRTLARLCREAIRNIDILGRYGGEEFLFLLPETDLQAAVIVAERLRKLFETTPISTPQSEIYITVSLGVTTLDSCSQDLDALIERADRALYEAKNSGRNSVVVK